MIRVGLGQTRSGAVATERSSVPGSSAEAGGPSGPAICATVASAARAICTPSSGKVRS